jgi:hypothetical protein
VSPQSLPSLSFTLAEENYDGSAPVFEFVVHQGIPSVQVLALLELAFAYASEIHPNIPSAPVPVMWLLYI